MIIAGCDEKKSQVLTVDLESVADAEMFSTFRAAGALGVMSGALVCFRDDRVVETTIAGA
jgi:hypothetical protein